jgi:hypothetical protein
MNVTCAIEKKYRKESKIERSKFLFILNGLYYQK